MAKYFKNIKNLEDLKAQFRTLARENHPDAGGDPEVMKAINLEYDQLFPIWKKRSGNVTNETADSTRREFYSATGWKGSNYSWRRDLKDVAAIVRNYIKETYPQYKFSVKKGNYNSIDITMKEAPATVFLNGVQPDWYGSFKARYANRFVDILKPDVIRMLSDITNLVDSYNFEDIDAMTDYYSVGFWFHGIDITRNLVIDPKRADRKAKTRKVAC